MPSQAIQSSVIKSVCHNANGLTVEFKSGLRYRYLNAPASEYLKICASILPGRYYIEHIKGKYFSKKLKPNEA